MILPKNILMQIYKMKKHQCGKNFLPHTVGRKRKCPLQDFPMADTSNVICYKLIVIAKSELNLQQLGHFHTPLKLLEIAFPRTKFSNFPGGAYPRTPVDTPAFEDFV